LVEAVRGGLGEPVTPLQETREQVAQAAAPKPQAAPLVPPTADEPLMAVPAAPGLTIAPAYVLRLPEFHYAERADNPARERERLERALAAGREQLQAL